MTSAQIEGLIRAVMGLFAGYALSVGIDGATWLVITGGVVGIATGLWSWYSNTITKQIENVAKSDEVTAVVTETKKLADAIPSEKVVSRHDTIASIGETKSAS